MLTQQSLIDSIARLRIELKFKNEQRLDGSQILAEIELREMASWGMKIPALLEAVEVECGRSDHKQGQLLEVLIRFKALETFEASSAAFFTCSHCAHSTLARYGVCMTCVDKERTLYEQASKTLAENIVEIKKLKEATAELESVAAKLRQSEMFGGEA